MLRGIHILANQKNDKKEEEVGRKFWRFDYFFLGHKKKSNFWLCVLFFVLRFWHFILLFERYKVHTESNFYFRRRFSYVILLFFGRGEGLEQKPPRNFCDFRCIFPIYRFGYNFYMWNCFLGGSGSEFFFGDFRWIFSIFCHFFLSFWKFKLCVRLITSDYFGQGGSEIFESRN